MNKVVKLPRKIINNIMNKKLNKAPLKLLIGLLSECDSSGRIIDFKRLFTFSRIAIKFFSGFSCNYSYAALEELIKDKFVVLDNNDLIILNYEDGFNKGGLGHILLPYIVFDMEFWSKEISAIHVMIDLLARLNNEKGKPTYIKADRITAQKYGKRCRQDIKNIIESIEDFFNVSQTDPFNHVYVLYLKNQYYISKETRAEGEKQDPLIKYKKRSKLIINALNSMGVKYTLQELKDIVLVLYRTHRYKVYNYLEKLAQRIYYGETGFAEPIRSKGAFLRSLVAT